MRVSAGGTFSNISGQSDQDLRYPAPKYPYPVSHVLPTRCLELSRHLL